jgi:hypothetical protein
MAKVILQHNPSLTRGKLINILVNYFGPIGYKVDASALVGTDIYIKKSGWVGVTIKLIQTANF